MRTLQKYEGGRGMRAVRVHEFAVSNSMGRKASPGSSQWSKDLKEVRKPWRERGKRTQVEGTASAKVRTWKS